MESYQKHFEESGRLRSEFWKTVGTMDKSMYCTPNKASFQSNPQWPSKRKGYLSIKTDNTTILASDGLSDPFDDFNENTDIQTYNGYGLEFYIETPGHIENIKSSWQFDLLFQTCEMAVRHGEIIDLLKKHAFLTTELYDIKVPEYFMNEDGRVGVLLGLFETRFKNTLKLSLETILIVNIKLLTMQEVSHVIVNGEKGRLDLADKFIKQDGESTFSYLDRKSVF